MLLPLLSLIVAPSLRTVTLSPDRTKAYAACSDGAVRVWNVADGTLAAKIAHGTEPLVKVAVGQGYHVVIGGEKNPAFDLFRDGTTAPLNLGTKPADIRVLPDGTLLTQDIETISLWDKETLVAEGRHKRTFYRADSTPYFAGADVSPDGKTVVAVGKLRCAYVWRAGEKKPTEIELKELGLGPAPVRFTPDGKSAAIVDGWRVKFLDLSNLKFGRTLEMKNVGGTFFAPIALGFSPSGTRLASSSYAGGLVVYDLSTKGSKYVAFGKPVRDLTSSEEPVLVTDVQFIDEDRLLAVVDGVPKVLDPKTGKALLTFPVD